MSSRVLFALSLAFWIWYWVVQLVLGPFRADDTFFLHMFWMLKNGARQYVDFYSYHLPAYFTLITPLLPSGSDLGFAWWFRIMAVLIAAALRRDDAPGSLALPLRLSRIRAHDRNTAGHGRAVAL
jgi:hypothetical protein